MGTVANLAVKIGVSSQDFQKGLDGVAASVDGMSSRFAKVGTAIAGAFSINAIAGAASHAIETASRIADMAERVGFSAEAVQRLEFAATQSGATFDAVATSIRVMSDRLTDGKLPAALASMGLSLEQLKGMTPDQAFVTIADAIARIPNPMLQSATAVDIFGRGAQSLLPAIKAGFTEIGEAAPIMSNALIASADATGDKWAEMTLRINNLKAQALLPLLDTFTQLPVSVQTATAGIAAFLPSLEGIGIAILAAGGPKAALGMLTEGFLAFGTFFTSTMPGLFAAGITFLTTTLPAAFGAVIAFLGPQGLIALGIIALGLIWYKWGDDITAVVTSVYTAVKTWLVDKWEGIATSMKTAIAGIGTVFLDVKNKAVTYAQQLFEGVKSWLLDRFSAIIAGIKTKVDAVTGYFRGMYEAVVGHSYVPDMVAGIASEFASLGSRMVQPTMAATGFVQQAFSTMASAVKGVVQNLIADLSGKLSGWLDGFMPAWAAKLAGGLATSVMQAGVGALGKAAGGGLIGSLLGGGTAAAGGIGAGASSGAGGMAAGIGGGIGMGTAIAATGGIAGAALLAWAIAKKGLFRGGEEALKVNRPRDEFLAQFGGAGTGAGSGFANLAARLTAITGQEGGGGLFEMLKSADTVKEFEAATKAINLKLAEGKTAQAELTTTTLGSNLAIDSFGLSATTATMALQGLALAASAVSPALMGSRGSGLPSVGFSGDFASLQDDMRSSESGVTVNAGTIIGNPDELAQMVTDAWEGGGETYNAFRILAGQAVG